MKIYSSGAKEVHAYLNRAAPSSPGLSLFSTALERALFVPFDFACTAQTWQLTRTTTGDLVPGLD